MGRVRHTMDNLEGHSPTICRSTSLRDRGPSNSTRKMFCHVPRTSCPLAIGNVRECPMKAEARCASALSSIALCAYAPDCGKRSPSLLRISLTSPFSFSLAIIAAVACGALTRHIPLATPARSTKSMTLSVISISCLLSEVLIARALLTTTVVPHLRPTLVP